MRHWLEEHTASIVKLYEEGYAPRRIVLILGLSYRDNNYFHMKRLLMKQGIQLRTASEAQAAKKKLRLRAERKQRQQQPQNQKPPKPYQLRGR